MKLLFVRNWKTLFENNRTRDLISLDWVPIPNKMDGDGFSQLLDHPDGMSHYAAWVLIVAVASKGKGADNRGCLLREGPGGVPVPHDHRSLARVTRGSSKIFEAAIPRLIAIGWLIEKEIELESENPALRCGNPASSCDEVPIEGKGREGNRREQNRREVSSELRAHSVLVLQFLNEEAGRSFGEVEEHLRMIRGRISDCQDDICGIKEMISRQVKMWKGDPKMDQYLRPQTLFAKSNFRSYYDDRSRPIPPRFDQRGLSLGGRAAHNPRNDAITGAERIREDARAADAAPDTGPWMAS